MVYELFQANQGKKIRLLKIRLEKALLSSKKACTQGNHLNLLLNVIWILKLHELCLIYEKKSDKKKRIEPPSSFFC
jgi:hypothetical protein